MPKFSLYRMDAGEIRFNQHQWWISFKNAARQQADSANPQMDAARTGR
jgi:hypothetical protein